MTRALALVLVVVFLVFQSGLTTPARVSIVRPVYIVAERQYLRFMVQVDPQDENRLLVLAAADDGGVVRSSREQLDGSSAPRTRWIDWREGLPAGEYMVVAILYSRTANEVARAQTPLQVLARY